MQLHPKSDLRAQCGVFSTLSAAQNIQGSIGPLKIRLGSAA